VLLKSYKEKTRWDKYKRKVLTEVLGPYENKPKRRDVIERAQATSLARAQSQIRDSRLISTLRRQNDPEVTLEDGNTSSMALDEPILVDHDDFESRLLRELDGKLTGNFRVMSINPGHGVRSQAMAGTDVAAVTSSNQISSVSRKSITLCD
jgi:hypothetical protein